MSLERAVQKPLSRAINTLRTKAEAVADRLILDTNGGIDLYPDFKNNPPSNLQPLTAREVLAMGQNYGDTPSEFMLTRAHEEKTFELVKNERRSRN